MSHTGGWGTKAIVAALTGLVISVLTSLIMVLGLAANLEPLVSIERVGADLGMRALWAFRLDDTLANGPPLVFVDADRPCPPSSAQAECAAQSPVTPELVETFLQAATASRAAVVIIDVAPPIDDPGRAGLKAMVANHGPYVIAPFESRPADQGDEARLAPSPATVLKPTHGERVRLASFQMSTSAGSDDGAVRRFAVVTPVEISGAQHTVPSVAYLTALLLSSRSRAAADCLYYENDCPSVSHAAVDELRNQDARRRGAAPIVYSLPSLAMPAQTRTADARQRETWNDNETWYAQRRYVRHSAQALLDDYGGKFPDKVFPPGAVVVLGSSAPRGHDIHQTPLGSMAGSEIILNAVRAFHARGPDLGLAPAPPDWLKELTAKIEGAVKTALLMWGIWSAIHALWARAKTLGPGARMAAGAANVLLFGLGMTGALYLELLDASQTLATSLSVGRSVDVLTPILLVGLDGYVEGLKALTGGIEALLERALGLARTMLARLRRRATSNLQRLAGPITQARSRAMGAVRQFLRRFIIALWRIRRAAHDLARSSPSGDRDHPVADDDGHGHGHGSGTGSGGESDFGAAAGRGQVGQRAGR